MHVLQYIAVQVENQLDDPKQEALHLVEQKLQNEMGGEEQYLSWYDWFVMGGGRWNVDPDNQYESSTNMIISYDEAPTEYRAMIDEMISNRKEEFSGYRKSFDMKEVDLNAKLDSYAGNMQYDFELYPLAKMIDMIQGKWDFNSYFFDIQHDSTNPEHMYKSIDIGNKNWYLVPVDFHF
jgi:hypothetical protein